MPQETPASPKAGRYGWVIVAIMLLVQTVSSGLGFYNMSVYINRLSVELGAPVAQISFAVSLFLLWVVLQAYMWPRCLVAITFASL